MRPVHKNSLLTCTTVNYEDLFSNFVVIALHFTTDISATTTVLNCMQIIRFLYRS